MKLLLDRGAKVKDRPATLAAAWNLALLNAAGDATATKPLLDEAADANYADEGGRTVLMLSAAKDYSLNAVRLLLDRGAVPNAADKEGNTALMFAVDRCAADVVTALLEAGADPNARDHHRDTVLIRAAASRHSYEESRKPLVHHKGAAVDDRDQDGNTDTVVGRALHGEAGPAQSCRGAARQGRNVNAANNDGETPLLCAASLFEAEAAELLLSAGAIVNARTKRGRTALMQAIDGPTQFDNEHHVVYSPRIARLLIEHGADAAAR